MRTHLCYMCERQCEGFSYSTFDLGAKPPLTPCGNIFEHVTRRISVRRCANTRQQVRSLKKSTSIMLEVCYCLEHRSRQAVVLRAVRQRDFVKMLTQTCSRKLCWIKYLVVDTYRTKSRYNCPIQIWPIHRALSTLHGTPER